MAEGGRLFKGVSVALLTLFDAAGAVDYQATADHARRLVDLGVTAVTIAGTTGEADSLDDEERVRLLAAVRSALPTTYLIMGTGASWRQPAARRTAAACSGGADAVLALSPARVADATLYYSGVIQAADGIPVLAYHHPTVSPPGVSVDTLRALPALSGCKDSSGDPERLLMLVSRFHGAVYTGSAPLVNTAGQLGAAGAILAVANAAPELAVAAFHGDVDAQLQLLEPHLKAKADFPAGVKALTAARFETATYSRIGR